MPQQGHCKGQCCITSKRTGPSMGTALLLVFRKISLFSLLRCSCKSTLTYPELPLTTELITFWFVDFPGKSCSAAWQGKGSIDGKSISTLWHYCFIQWSLILEWRVMNPWRKDTVSSHYGGTELNVQCLSISRGEKRRQVCSFSVSSALASAKAASCKYSISPWKSPASGS